MIAFRELEKLDDFQMNARIAFDVSIVLMWRTDNRYATTLELLEQRGEMHGFKRVWKSSKNRNGRGAWNRGNKNGKMFIYLNTLRLTFLKRWWNISTPWEVKNEAKWIQAIFARIYWKLTEGKVQSWKKYPGVWQW